MVYTPPQDRHCLVSDLVFQVFSRPLHSSFRVHQNFALYLIVLAWITRIPRAKVDGLSH